jgi:hypothetical protein
MVELSQSLEKVVGFLFYDKISYGTFVQKMLYYRICKHFITKDNRLQEKKCMVAGGILDETKA